MYVNLDLGFKKFENIPMEDLQLNENGAQTEFRIKVNEGVFEELNPVLNVIIELVDDDGNKKILFNGNVFNYSKQIFYENNNVVTVFYFYKLKQ